MKRIPRSVISKESYVLTAICLCDLALTLWLIHDRRATEGNPVMSFYMERSMTLLIAMKIALIAVPIFIVEWARRYHPVFVRRMLRVGIAVYIGMYAVAIARSDIVEIRTGQVTAPPLCRMIIMQQIRRMNSHRPNEYVATGSHYSTSVSDRPTFTASASSPTVR
jgi:hypothetical protein